MSKDNIAALKALKERLAKKTDPAALAQSSDLTPGSIQLLVFLAGLRGYFEIGQSGAGELTPVNKKQAEFLLDRISCMSLVGADPADVSRLGGIQGMLQILADLPPQHCGGITRRIAEAVGVTCAEVDTPSDGDADGRIRETLEQAIGRTPDPACSTVQLARELADLAERRRIDAEHYRSEAGRISEYEAAQLELEGAKATIRELEARLALQPEPWRKDAEHYREERVAHLERAIVAAVEHLACHDLHGDETARVARQEFAGLGIPGLVKVRRCAACSEPLKDETECPDCKTKLDEDNVIAGLEVGDAEGDD